MIKKSLISLALLGASTNIMASAYIGGGVGSVDIDVSGFDDPTGFELMIGKEISSNLSIEASFIDFGESSDGIAPQWRVTGNSLAFGALAKAPINEGFDVFLKVGLHMWDAELTEDGFGLLAEDDGTDIFYGIGAIFNVNNKFSLDARYNSYDMDGDDVTMFSLNAQVAF
ncbi:MAG: porin family protein [Gammaproteobacteria bacterium]|nr:porin family protein [Gammaproteobacteria bacterium]